MKLTAPKTTEKTTKKLKFNVFNIKSLLVFNRKKLDKVKKENQRFSLFQKKKEKVKQKEEKIESPRTMGSTLKNIAGSLLAKPKSIIDKFKEFFGIILLGILVNNLPRIIKELQNVLGKIKEFFDNNPWIGKTIKFAFDIIAKGMMGILDLTKTLMPVIGGSFKFALDTIKTTKNEIGKLIKFFDDLGGGIGALMTSFGANKPQPQPKPQSKPNSASRAPRPMSQQPFAPGGKPAIRPVPYGPGGSSTGSGRGQFNYKQVIKKQAQRAQAAPARGYDPNAGTTLLGTKKTGYIPQILAPDGGVMGSMVKGQRNTWGPLSTKPGGIDPKHLERYQAVSQANKVQKFSLGGTIRNFFSGMFGGSRRGLGNIPPQEGTGRGSPSDIKLTTKDDGKSYTGPYASPAGTAKGRKARETVNYFKIFENNIDLQNRRLGKEEKNLDLFSEFMKSYENLSALRKKYGDEGLNVPPGPGGTSQLPDEAVPVNENEVIGKVGSTGQSTGPHIHLEAMTQDKKIPLSLRKNIFVNGKSLTSNNFTSSSPVGMRMHPIKKRMIYHAGEDWPAAANSQITLRGGVKFVKYVKEGSDPRYDGYGNVTVIQDTDGKQYFMGHLNAGPSNLSALLQRQQQQMQQKTPGKGAEKMWNFFRSKGLSEIAVAGIVGNADEESKFDPRARGERMGPNGTDALGLFQWGEKNRWQSLVGFAKKYKLDPWDFDTQLRFAWNELNMNYYQPALEGIKNAKTPEQAAEVWRTKYEVARGGVTKRQVNARRWYNTYKGKSIQTAPSVQSPLTKTQQLEKNIVSTMINDLGTRSITVGDKNVSIEKKDGKDVIKVTTGGVFGIGARQLQLDENLLNNLLYEIKNKNKLVQPVKKQGGPDGSSGVLNNASTNIVFVNEKIAYLLPGPSQVVPVPGPTQIVPVNVSQRTSNSIELRFTLA